VGDLFDPTFLFDPPYTPHPTPYTLHPTPYTPHLTPCALHPTLNPRARDGVDGRSEVGGVPGASGAVGEVHRKRWEAIGIFLPNKQRLAHSEVCAAVRIVLVTLVSKPATLNPRACDGEGASGSSGEENSKPCPRTPKPSLIKPEPCTPQTTLYTLPSTRACALVATGQGYRQGTPTPAR